MPKARRSCRFRHIALSKKVCILQKRSCRGLYNLLNREVKFLQFQGQKCAEAREAMGLVFNNYWTDAMDKSVTKTQTMQRYLEASLLVYLQKIIKFMILTFLFLYNIWDHPFKTSANFRDFWPPPPQNKDVDI